MKIDFTDGYIEVKESGNTYVGEVAHEFMHLASKFSRDNGVDFQDALMMHIKQFWVMVDGEVNRIRQAN